LSKIGTGEGAQAYGHGVYLAESEKVAKTYRDNLLDARIPEVNKRMSEISKEMDKISSGYRQWKPGQENIGRRLSAEYDALMDARTNYKGHMYQAKIGAKPENFMDWYKPLYDQPKNVQQAFGWDDVSAAKWKRARELENDILMQQLKGRTDIDRRASLTENVQKRLDASRTAPFNATGEEAYRKKVAKQGKPDAASADLNRSGVPGIRYKDAFSRGNDGVEGTSNYVVFDDKLIEVLKKYGLAGVSLAGALGAAVPQQDKQSQGGI
jgi:hypothetical protein